MLCWPCISQVRFRLYLKQWYSARSWQGNSTESSAGCTHACRKTACLAPMLYVMAGTFGSYLWLECVQPSDAPVQHRRGWSRWKVSVHFGASAVQRNPYCCCLQNPQKLGLVAARLRTRVTSGPFLIRLELHIFTRYMSNSG